MSLPVIILGAGGHAKVLIGAMLATSAVIKGVVDSNTALVGSRILGVPVLGGDDVVAEFNPSQIRLVNGVGSIGLPVLRQRLYERFKILGYDFATVVHPSAVVASDVVIGEGAQVMAGTVIQPGSQIGCNTIINTRASVDHDCIISDHVHISPGVTFSGGVDVGAGSHIGTGATLIQGVSIGRGCLVSAGAVVVKDISAGIKVRGVPAREFV
ncbi:acetyltransferase [Desulfuromonas carbonis]|uniref:acetyltransferase n=1 Tax=Desulfuromonas sp. DDH964 TaxID=1823759 RepID=UPI00078DD6FF|nr:acetyltransferase [Desulfuromonas sp. DDH964]AMV71855.1 acyltransferase [Desulfuromonas sp. DDH964]